MVLKAVSNLSAYKYSDGKAIRLAPPWSEKLIKTVSEAPDFKILPFPPLVAYPVMILMKFSGVTDDPL